jgi:hypothetical protein
MRGPADFMARKRRDNQEKAVIGKENSGRIAQRVVAIASKT